MLTWRVGAEGQEQTGQPEVCAYAAERVAGQAAGTVPAEGCLEHQGSSSSVTVYAPSLMILL